jgi:hypothetical protein
MLRKAEAHDRQELRLAVATAEEELDAWLGAPVLAGSVPGPAYVAFSNMRIAADSA